MTAPLETVLEGYKSVLELLEAADMPDQTQALGVLVARDAVQALWIDLPQHSAEVLTLLYQLDKRLKQQADRIIQAIDLADVRTSLNPASTAWWWFLENACAPTPLNAAIERYKAALAAFEADIAQPARNQQSDLLIQTILEVFLAREALQTQLNATPSAEALMKVNELDDRLRQQFDRMLPKVHRESRRKALERLENLRDLSKPPETAWWWFQKVPIHVWDRFDLAWNMLTLMWLAATFSLLVDISTRFLSGSPGTIGAFAVIFQSILALAGGGALTKTGQEAIDRILKNLRVPRWLWQESKFLAASILLLCFIGLRLSLPRIAVEYNNNGFQDYLNGRLDSAEKKYKRAVELFPDYTEAHYNLGLLYEDLQNLERARTEYSLAVQSEFPLAHNNLARLYIIEGKYPNAVSLLSKGIASLEANAQIQPKEGIRYSLYKNNGWARFKQGRYEEAKADLEVALTQAGVEQKTSAYCLLAQTLEKLKEKQNALVNYQRCSESPINENSPEEDDWVHLAEQRLKAAGRKP